MHCLLHRYVFSIQIYALVMHSEGRYAFCCKKWFLYVMWFYIKRHCGHKIATTEENEGLNVIPICFTLIWMQINLTGTLCYIFALLGTSQWLT